MRLCESIYMVGSGEFLLTDYPAARPFYDCHVFLVDGGTELALVDAGYGGTVDQILGHLERWGLDRDLLRRCLLTHAHHDHARGAAEWQSRLGLEICASAATAESLARPGLRALAYSCPDGTFPPCVVDRVLGDSDTVHVGHHEITALSTPGHAAGHLAYLLDLPDVGRAAFVGDLFQCDGIDTDLGYPLDADHDATAQAQSLYRLCARRPEVVLPSHGMLAMTTGHRWLGRALHGADKVGMTG